MKNLMENKKKKTITTEVANLLEKHLTVQFMEEHFIIVDVATMIATVKNLRLKEGMTVVEISQFLGMTTASIYKYLRVKTPNKKRYHMNAEQTKVILSKPHECIGDLVRTTFEIFGIKVSESKMYHTLNKHGQNPYGKK